MRGHGTHGRDTLALWDQGDLTGMRGIAHELGLRYCDTPEDRTYQEEIGGIPRIGVVALDDDAPISDLIYGRYGGCNVQLFNLDLSTYPEDPGNTRRSCVVLTFYADFPRLQLGPHSRMTRLQLERNRRWLDFAPGEFRARYHVVTADNDTARAILGDSLTSWLMATPDEVRFTLEGGALIGHVPRLTEEAWPGLVDRVVGFQRALPEQAWVDFGAFRFP